VSCLFHTVYVALRFPLSLRCSVSKTT